MATHTDSGAQEFGRRFTIARENGQVDKNSRPYFFEWAKEIPTDPGKRKFVTRKNGKGEDRYYGLFAALDGRLINVEKYQQDFGGTKEVEDWLKMVLIDGTEEYVIEVGKLDGRYSMDIMKRLLDDNFDPNQKLHLAPISSKSKENGKTNMFLSAYSGVNKLEAKYSCQHLEGMPQGEKYEIPGKKPVWSYTNAANWLYEQVTRRVAPQLMKDPISAPTGTHTPQAEYKKAGVPWGIVQTVPPPVNTAVTANHEAPDDDLPF